MTKIHAVVKEYQEPFRDVVRGFAKMGYSRKAVSGTLGFAYSHFGRLCVRFDLKKHFDRKNYLSICKPPGPKKGVKMPQKYDDAELMEILSKYPKNISVRQFRKLQNKPDAQVYQRRFGSWSRAKALAHGRRNDRETEQEGAIFRNYY